MKRILEIGVGIVLVAAIVVVVIFKVLGGTPAQTPVTSNPYPSAQDTGSSGTTVVPANSGTQTADNTISIAAADGGTIQTNNFLTDIATTKDPVNPDYYYLGYHFNEGTPDPTATDNPPYVIEYIAATQYFNIGLFQEPIGVERLVAEQYLMNKLGISQTQMCQLKYMVSVPNRVNQFYSGTDLRFSFCTDAVPL